MGSPAIQTRASINWIGGIPRPVCSRAALSAPGTLIRPSQNARHLTTAQAVMAVATTRVPSPPSSARSTTNSACASGLLSSSTAPTCQLQCGGTTHGRTSVEQQESGPNDNPDGAGPPLKEDVQDQSSLQSFLRTGLAQAPPQLVDVTLGAMQRDSIDGRLPDDARQFPIVPPTRGAAARPGPVRQRGVFGPRIVAYTHTNVLPNVIVRRNGHSVKNTRGTTNQPITQAAPTAIAPCPPRRRSRTVDASSAKAAPFRSQKVLRGPAPAGMVSA